MNPRVVLVEDWPQPDTVEPAIVSAGPSKLAIFYGTGDEAFAVITFQSWSDLKMGGPNDEALNGHPLYNYGLQPYSIHRIEDSPWLDALDRQNAAHPLHSSARFRDSKVHYLFALKEETIECVVAERDIVTTVVEVFDSREDALRRVKEAIDA
jgi:hypothetical protein